MSNQAHYESRSVISRNSVGKRRHASKALNRRPSCEQLEDRRLLTTVEVLTSGDLGAIKLPDFNESWGTLVSAQVDVATETSATARADIPFSQHSHQFGQLTCGPFGVPGGTTDGAYTNSHLHTYHRAANSGALPGPDVFQPNPSFDSVYPCSGPNTTAESAGHYHQLPIGIEEYRVWGTYNFENAGHSYHRDYDSGWTQGQIVMPPGTYPSSWYVGGSRSFQSRPLTTSGSEWDFTHGHRGGTLGGFIYEAPDTARGIAPGVDPASPEMPVEHSHSVTTAGLRFNVSDPSMLEWYFTTPQRRLEPVSPTLLTLPVMEHQHQVHAGWIPYTAVTTFTFDPPPAADAGGPYYAEVGVPASLSASGSTDHDASGDKPPPYIKYEWDYGTDAPAFDKGIRGESPLVTFHESYSGTLFVRVTDSLGQSDIATTQLVVVDGAAKSGHRYEDGVLSVVGTDNQDWVRFSQFRDTLIVHSSFLDNRRESIPIEDMTSVFVDLRGGNDRAHFRASGIPPGTTVVMRGGPGNDRLTAAGIGVTLFGDGGNDYLVGSSHADELVGGPGNDRLIGKGGDDRLSGDGGNDWILGGRGDDLLRGGPGDDVLRGGWGDDILVGQAGRDALFGQSGYDLLIGGLGTDLLLGWRGPDILIDAYTSFDDNDRALQAIRAEWTNSDHDWETRVNSIQGTAILPTATPALNDHFFLRMGGTSPTVHDDLTRDIVLDLLWRWEDDLEYLY